MVSEQGVEMIVMLTNLEEYNRIKCAQVDLMMGWYSSDFFLLGATTTDPALLYNSSSLIDYYRSSKHLFGWRSSITDLFPHFFPHILKKDWPEDRNMNLWRALGIFVCHSFCIYYLYLLINIYIFNSDIYNICLKLVLARSWHINLWQYHHRFRPGKKIFTLLHTFIRLVELCLIKNKVHTYILWAIFLSFVNRF